MTTGILTRAMVAVPRVLLCAAMLFSCRKAFPLQMPPRVLVTMGIQILEMDVLRIVRLNQVGIVLGQGFQEQIRLLIVLLLDVEMPFKWELSNVMMRIF